MIILIAGSSHTGKTMLAQKLLQKYAYPYLSIDHLKMGLIRSGICKLLPNSSDEELTAYLWPVITEMIKTVIENHQNLIVEGCYIPMDYKSYFTESELVNIRFMCLIFSERYLNHHMEKILQYENIAEKRKYSGINRQELLEENLRNLQLCKKYDHPYVLIDETYDIDADILS